MALGHSELRWVSRPSGSPAPVDAKEERKISRAPSGFFGTCLPSNWTAAELSLYDKLFASLETSADVQSDFLAQSQLPRRALREIWQVANPHLKMSLGLEEFRASCRLVAHCQAMNDEEALKRLRAGGGKLRAQLRSDCLGVEPQSLPQFEAEAQKRMAKKSFLGSF